VTESFVHVFTPGTTSTTLLLLHGTGGDERDLLPLGEMLLPGAAILSPRGQVLEHGMPRFFRRLAEGVFDEVDLRQRAGDLARFVASTAERHHFDARKVIAVGFSNGANIASALLLLHPGVLAGAILFRAMVPLVPDSPPSLESTRV
jgi:phospholipase/carboxylesterase